MSRTQKRRRLTDISQTLIGELRKGRQSVALETSPSEVKASKGKKSD